MKPDEMALTADEICRIIETCGRSGVAKMQFGALSLEMRAVELSPVATDPAPNPDTAISASQIEKVAQDNLEDEELKLREDELERLSIEDPAEYERMRLSGELEDAGPENNGSESAIS